MNTTQEIDKRNSLANQELTLTKNKYKKNQFLKRLKSFN